MPYLDAGQAQVQQQTKGNSGGQTNASARKHGGPATLGAGSDATDKQRRFCAFAQNAKAYCERNGPQGLMVVVRRLAHPMGVLHHFLGMG